VTHVPLLNELAIVAALGVMVTVLLSKLKLPAVAGLLAAGALLGPYGLGLATSVRAIEMLADVGVVLLLFSIGLEFSIGRLGAILRRVALGGFLQVGLTAGATTGVALLAGEPTSRAIFYGLVFSLSSTAIVLRALTERRELDAPHGRFIVGTLIFQDLCVVPMVLLVPLLSDSGQASGVWLEIGTALGKATLLVVCTVAVSRLIVPRALGWVDASRSREAFLLAILGLCLGTAWLTSLAGLSLALGAFLGGMVVADTQYGHRAMGDILSLRDVFVSLFFVSLGMLFDGRTALARAGLVLSLLAGLLLGKGLIATIAALAMRFPARVAWLAGVGLAQFGEFGFVLTRLAEEHQVLSKEASQPLLAAGILSMFITPLLVRVAPHVTAGERLLAPLERLIGVRGIDEVNSAEQPLSGHVVVVGFGLAGQYAASTLRACGVPCLILELNSENVKRGKARGYPVYYADATSQEALEHAGVARARLVVLLMNDTQGAQRVVDALRRLAPEVPVLMRSRYLAEREGLLQLGARDVVAEEVEGAVEMVARLLRWVEVPRNVIELQVRAIRSETQTSARRQTAPRPRLSELRGLDELKIEPILVHAESAAAGASAISLRLRSSTGVLLVGLRRNEQLLETLDDTATLAPGDIAYLVGTGDALARASGLFDPQNS
jgi:monovalent cation:H+ antiporter-2, CPA2 family